MNLVAGASGIGRTHLKTCSENNAIDVIGSPIRDYCVVNDPVHALGRTGIDKSYIFSIEGG
jgi:hypothetical protein